MILRLLTICCLLPLLLAGCVSKESYLLKEDEVSLLRRTIADLESQYADLQSRSAELAAERDALGEKLTEALEANSKAQQRILAERAEIERIEHIAATRAREAEAEEQRLKQRITDLQKRIETLNATLEAERSRLQAQNADLVARNRELADQLEKERIAQRARLAHMKSTFDELVGKMDAEIRRGEITISELEGKLTVNMLAQILFDSGQATVKQEGLAVLERVARVLKQVEDKQIIVEGHTDNQPISTRLKETFPTNWELSTARATNVLHFLQDQGGIPGERLSACGFGPYRPVASNDTAEGRAQNRRIQIVLAPLEKQPAAP